MCNGYPILNETKSQLFDASTLFLITIRNSTMSLWTPCSCSRLGLLAVICLIIYVECKFPKLTTALFYCSPNLTNT